MTSNLRLFMFNLEQAIADWRKQMLAAGIKTPVPLEELEIHLREEIERQMKSGMAAQHAIEIAVKKIGPAKSFENEFQKAGLFTLKLPERITFVVVGICFAVAGLGVLSLGIFARTQDWTKSPEVSHLLVIAYILHAAMLAGGLFLTICGCKKVSWLPKKRGKYV
jgi:hypothetical protein